MTVECDISEPSCKIANGAITYTLPPWKEGFSPAKSTSETFFLKDISGFSIEMALTDNFEGGFSTRCELALLLKLKRRLSKKVVPLIAGAIPLVSVALADGPKEDTIELNKGRRSQLRDAMLQKREDFTNTLAAQITASR